MKILNYIDLAFQTFILGAVILSSVAILLTGSFESIGIIAMYGALFLGPWQLVSSLATCLARGLYFKWRLIHLISSIVYLALISVLVAFFARVEFGDTVELIGRIIGFAIPTVLALFYYYITVKSFMLGRATRVATTL